MEEGIQIIFKGTLEEFIGQHNKVLVIFFSDTCSKCHFWMKNLVDLAGERDEDGDPFVVAYNAGEDQDTCEVFGITSVPMLIAFENGEEIGRLDEIQTNDFIKQHFRNEGEGDNLSVRVQIESDEA